MKILNLVDGEVKIDPEILVIPEFDAVWKTDKTKDKHKAFETFTYIYHCCDLASPYANFPMGKREEAVRQDLISDKTWKETKEIKSARAKFIEMSTTPLQRLLSASQRKIDEIAQFLDETPVDVDTVASVLKIMNDLSKTVNQFAALNETVTKEQKANSTKRRGEKSSALFED
jgi:hypothetical protein